MTDDRHIHPAVKQKLEQEHARALRAAEAEVAAARLEHGDIHPRVAKTLCALGELHQRHSDFDSAEAAFLQALAIREKNPADTQGLVGALRALARFYESRGENGRSRPLMQRAARTEAQAFQADMRPVESLEPEYSAHADFVEEMAGSAPRTFWTELLGGVLLPGGLALRGVSIAASRRTAFYGLRGSMLHDPLIVTGGAAVMIGLVWLCAALLAHFHFFWPYRNRTLCSYGKTAAFVVGILLLFGALAAICAG